MYNAADMGQISRNNQGLLEVHRHWRCRKQQNSITHTLKGTQYWSAIFSHYISVISYGHSSITGGGQNGNYCRCLSGPCSRPSHSPSEPFWATMQYAGTCQTKCLLLHIAVAARNAPMARGRGQKHGTLQSLQYLSFCPPLATLLYGCCHTILSSTGVS